MRFIKMEGIGNDYVYVDCFKEKIHNPSKVAQIVSDRHFGVGGDGLILICPSDHADVRMDMYNLDGSKGEMCGNGSRCVAKYAYDHGYVTKKEFVLDTLAGDKHIVITDKDGKAELIQVDMGEAKLTSELPEKITVAGLATEFVGVDVGNPHAVYYVGSKKELDELDLEKIGPLYECHERFPKKVNSEFIYIEDKKNLFMRVWERGSGETLACGTGATASAYASMRLGLCDDDVMVHLRGGNLKIRHDAAKNAMFMTGPAREVFHGEIEIEGED